jgi:hypothetical protein
LVYGPNEKHGKAIGGSTHVRSTVKNPKIANSNVDTSTTLSKKIQTTATNFADASGSG